FGLSATLKLLNFQRFLPNQHQAKLKSQTVRLEGLRLIFQGIKSELLMIFLRETNARLRG
ncbi:hypothetical protein DDN83_18545, partial [Vibrio cholerae]|nr:hypothetical protein [Vibrio cholerae]